MLPTKALSISLLAYNWGSALAIRCKPTVGAANSPLHSLLLEQQSLLYATYSLGNFIPVIKTALTAALMRSSGSHVCLAAMHIAIVATFI